VPQALLGLVALVALIRFKTDASLVVLGAGALGLALSFAGVAR
jgi:hypothetical protein